MNEAAEFLLTLLHSSTNTHLLHWTTKSYAEHVALGTFYSEIIELTDQLAEAMMGKYDTTPTFPASYYAPAATGKEELEALKDYVAVSSIGSIYLKSTPLALIQWCLGCA
jgi:DNA-binding ferritin-like protein